MGTRGFALQSSYAIMVRAACFRAEARSIRAAAGEDQRLLPDGTPELIGWMCLRRSAAGSNDSLLSLLRPAEYLHGFSQFQKIKIFDIGRTSLQTWGVTILPL